MAGCPLYIHNKVSKRILKQFVNRQKLAIAGNSKLIDSLLILDDCFDPSFIFTRSGMFIPLWMDSLFLVLFLCMLAMYLFATFVFHFGVPPVRVKGAMANHC